MRSSGRRRSREVARRVGAAAAGARDPTLTDELAQLAETEPRDDADGHARELLTWVMTGAALATTKWTASLGAMPAAISATGLPLVIRRRRRLRAVSDRALGPR